MTLPARRTRAALHATAILALLQAEPAAAQQPADFPSDPGAQTAAALPAPPAPAWIEVDRPIPGQIVQLPLGLVELRGRIGGSVRPPDDLVIALDQSQSSLLPSGLDVDGDGIVAALANPKWKPATVPYGRFRTWTTDPEDTVIRAAQLGVTRLLEGFDPERTRVALVRFSGEARVIAPLGAPAAARAVLDALLVREDWTGSDISAAIQRGLDVLDADGDPAPERQRAILLVTDGIPTAPRNDQYAAYRARELAKKARRLGIPVHVFEVPHIEDPDHDDSAVLTDIAALSDGSWTRVDRPDQLRFELPHVGAQDAGEVQVRNETSGEAARALRVFPGGAFDAFLPLQLGENEIAISARLQDGREVRITRTIEYLPGETRPEDLARIEALRDELRRRTLETENLPVPRPPAELERRLSIRPGSAAEQAPADVEKSPDVEKPPDAAPASP